MRSHDYILGLMAEGVSDLERSRIATENRIRQLTRDEPDEDGLVRGFALPEDAAEVVALVALRDGMTALEKESVKALEKAMKAHPLGPWVLAQKGVGLKQAARLLAAIGDPYWNDRDECPRTVSQLWSYSGFRVEEGVGVRRRKGTVANWSNEAKMRAYLIAESCVKQRGGEYREVYDKRKAHTEGRVHVAPCPPCHAKEAGIPWKDGHRHADALRFLAKRVLKDMWQESKRLHEAEAAS